MPRQSPKAKLVHDTVEEEDAALSRAIEEGLREEGRVSIEEVKRLLREMVGD